MQHEMRRVASERLGGAIDLLDAVLESSDGNGSDVDLEAVVHDVRKRCKASRGLARLARPALGDDFRTFDRAVRGAANQLSELRDSHAILGTFDALLASNPDDDMLRTMRDCQAAKSVESNRAGTSNTDDRIAAARALLGDALKMSQHWKIPRGFDVPEAGIVATYRQGRLSLRRLRTDPTDDRLHEWRKAVKYLWYQMQLVHEAAPSVLGPLVAELDRLAELLGDDHDLTVLVELLDAQDERNDTAHVRRLARQRQAALRAHALRSGATIYSEPDHAFGHRIERYWRTAIEVGPEDIIAAREEPIAPAGTDARSLVERERKFLIETVPEPFLGVAATALRQGYLAAGDRRSVRVRDAGRDGCTLTFKAGAGAERTELEWPIERREFEAAWAHTDDRRVEKTRRRIPHGKHVIELDVFGGELTGLVIAEVEFSSADSMSVFDPPAWFGPEVTDDGRYTNASLALHGLPDE